MAGRDVAGAATGASYENLAVLCNYSNFMKHASEVSGRIASIPAVDATSPAYLL